MIKLLTATVTILIAAVIGLGYVAFFYEAHDKAHTQELDEKMVTYLMLNHVNKLIESAGITSDNADEMDDVWEELPGYGCLWSRDIDIGTESFKGPYPHIHGPDKNGVSYSYIDTKDIWLATTIVFPAFCGEFLEDADGKSVLTWTIDDNTGEVTYGRPDYDLYESGRTTDSSGSQPPTSEDICASAQRLLNLLAGDSALEIRTEVFKTQLAHGCYK